MLCGYDQFKNPMYCYQLPVTTTPPCPANCSCLTETEAKKLNYVYWKNEKTLCEYDSYQNPKYCYEKLALTPTTPLTTPTEKPDLVISDIWDMELGVFTRR